MGFDRHFTLGLIWRLVLLQVALAAAGWSLLTPGLAAVRIIACLVAAGAACLLWSHVFRTNREIARFVEALRHGDYSAHFDGGRGAGFAQMGNAFNAAIRRLREERRAASDELRFLETLVDDVPMPLLTIDGEGHVRRANKAARRLFGDQGGVRAEDFAVHGATFASRLDLDGPVGAEVLVLNLSGRAQRAIVSCAALTRLGARARAVIVQPVQDTLNAVEMAAQTDLVRVLTHEILNSLTPVTSLAATAAALMKEIEDPRLRDAQLAVATLERRVEGLARFIHSYRKVASEPRVARRRFEAAPFATEMVRLFAAEWPDADIRLAIEPPAFTMDADPDLLAQAVINLLRNAGEASRHAARPRVDLSLERRANGEVLIAVSDNGPGVPVDLRRDIFLPFFTTRASGTGVGLNLVRQIVIGHGGIVEVRDAPLGGARFELLL